MPRSSQRPKSGRPNPKRNDLRPARKSTAEANEPRPYDYLEADIVVGTADFVREEVEAVSRVKWYAAENRPWQRPNELPFRTKRPWEHFVGLKSANAILAVQRYEISRPKGLLGDQNARRLKALVDEILSAGRRQFKTFRLNAAGKESSVLERLRQMIGDHTGLTSVDGEGEGDLLLRLRSAQDPRGARFWEVAVRVTARPLSFRKWRVENYAGALSGPLAHIANLMTAPTPHDRYLNLMCGSGSLMVERLELPVSALRCVGIDNKPNALTAAARNLSAAGENRTPLIVANGTMTPFPDQNFTVITADLPWGQLVQAGSNGAHRLYQDTLAEAARLLVSGGRCVLVVHAERPIQHAVADNPDVWRIDQVVQLQHGHVTPYLIRLTRL